MKKCNNCGSILEDDELYCHECGTKQEIEDVKTPVEEKQEREEKKCFHCGKAIEADSAFCPFCGKPQEVEEVKNKEPQQEQPEAEQLQTNNQISTPPPLSKQSKQTETKEQPASVPPPLPKQPKENEIPEPPTYEYEEEEKSRKWLWVLLALLVAGGVGVWYYMSDGHSSKVSVQMADSLDSTSIEEDDVPDTYIDSQPTSALEFLEQFYMGDYEDEEYIKQHVTANVWNKLKHEDMNEDCDDCLATWVFTAYPPGSNLFLEEGPIIKESKEEGKYSVLYTYYSQGQSGRIYKHRGLLFSVTQIDGKYRISDYELVMPDIVQKPSDLSEGKDGQYYLRDGRMFLHLEKTGPDILADFDFRDGAYVSATYYFNCQLDEENKFSSMVYYANGECVGKIEGILEEGVMNVNVGVDNKYRGSYGFILSDDENEND